MKHLKIFSFILLIILLSFLVNAFNSNFYNEKFKENGAYEKFGEEAYAVNTEVFKYFSLRGDLETDFFDEKEKEHLRDVRNLFIGGYILLLISFSSLYFTKKTELNFILLRTGIIGSSIILLLVFFSYINFNSLFTWFHKLFFEEGSWLFSENDNLVNLYTFDLFYELFLRILLTAIVLFFFSILLSRVKIKYFQ